MNWIKNTIPVYPLVLTVFVSLFLAAVDVASRAVALAEVVAEVDRCLVTLCALRWLPFWRVSFAGLLTLAGAIPVLYVRLNILVLSSRTFCETLDVCLATTVFDDAE